MKKKKLQDDICNMNHEIVHPIPVSRELAFIGTFFSVHLLGIWRNQSFASWIARNIRRPLVRHGPEIPPRGYDKLKNQNTTVVPAPIRAAVRALLHDNGKPKRQALKYDDEVEKSTR